MSHIAIGLSIGTSSAIVAISTKNSQINVAINETGNRSTPAIAAFFDSTDENILFGSDAIPTLTRYPENSLPFLLLLLSKFEKQLQLSSDHSLDMKVDPSCAISIDDLFGCLSKDYDLKGELLLIGTRELKFSYMKELFTRFLSQVVEKVIFPNIKNILGDIQLPNSQKVHVTISIPNYASVATVYELACQSLLSTINCSIQVIPRSFAALMGILPELLLPSDNIRYLSLTEKSSVLAGARDSVDLSNDTAVLLLTWGINSLSAEILIISGGVIKKDYCYCSETKVTCGTALVDEIIANRILQDFCKRFYISSTENISARSKRKLLLEVGEARRALCNSSTIQIHVEAFYEGMDLCEVLSRTRFERLIKETSDLPERPLSEVISALFKKYARMNIDSDWKVPSITKVVTAGGAFCIPIFIDTLHFLLFETQSKLTSLATNNLGFQDGNLEVQFLNLESSSKFSSGFKSNEVYAFGSCLQSVVMSGLGLPLANQGCGLTVSLPQLENDVFLLFSENEKFKNSLKWTEDSSEWTISCHEVQHLMFKGSWLPQDHNIPIPKTDQSLYFLSGDISKGFPNNIAMQEVYKIESTYLSGVTNCRLLLDENGLICVLYTNDQVVNVIKGVFDSLNNYLKSQN